MATVDEIKRSTRARLYSEAGIDVSILTRRMYKEDVTAVSGNGYRGFTVQVMCASPENKGVPREMSFSIRADTAEQAKSAALDVASRMNFTSSTITDVIEVPQPDHLMGTGTSVNAEPVGIVVPNSAIHPGLAQGEIPTINTHDFDDLPNNILGTAPQTRDTAHAIAP